MLPSSSGAAHLGAMANSGIALPLHVISDISQGMQENQQDNSALLTHWLNTTSFPSTNQVGNLTASASDLDSLLSLSSDVVNSLIPLNNAYFSQARLINSDLNGTRQVLDQSYQQQQQNPLNNAALLTTSNIYSYSQDDILYGNTGDNFLSGGWGNDTIYGNAGDDILLGGNGRDFISGGSGDDLIYGGNDNDILHGDQGHDFLVGYGGGTEYDTLTGGTGTDTFVLGNSSETFYQGYGYAQITDFDYLADYIQVMGSGNQYSLRTLNGFGDWWAEDTGIYHGNDLVGVVQDTTNVNFNRDFIFV
ncbi:MAG: calcium-binding protein [Crocosphaera sp.]